MSQLPRGTQALTDGAPGDVPFLFSPSPADPSVCPSVCLSPSWSLLPQTHCLFSDPSICPSPQVTLPCIWHPSMATHSVSASCCRYWGWEHSAAREGGCCASEVSSLSLNSLLSPVVVIGTVVLGTVWCCLAPTHPSTMPRSHIRSSSLSVCPLSSCNPGSLPQASCPVDVADGSGRTALHHAGEWGQCQPRPAHVPVEGRVLSLCPSPQRSVAASRAQRSSVISRLP